MSFPRSSALCLMTLALSLFVVSCEMAPDGGAAPAEGAAGEGSAAMRGFSWVISGRVAGMPRPGVSQPLDRDLQFLRDQGVDVLVSLTEEPLDPKALERYGIQALHIPVPDYHAPTQEQLALYVNAVQGWMSAGLPVATHCGAGLGRTGTFLAALFVAQGMDADAAIAEIRRLRPGSIETPEQEQAVREFAER